MKTEAQKAVDTLLRGVSTGQVETVRDGWRAVLQGGAASVAIIRDKLNSPTWETAPRGPVSKYFCVLLIALDELDPDAFAREVAALRLRKLNPMHARALRMLSQRVLDKPATRVGDGIPVYVAAEIADREIVVGNIERWSLTKGLSLENVTRIDVIARNPDMDYLGRYNILYSGIILTWPSYTARGIKLWWRRLDAEFTFYHEVGHHACGHLEGGTVVEQEKEADDYARALMRSSRPIFAAVGRIVLWPLKALLAGHIARAKARAHPAYRGAE